MENVINDDNNDNNNDNNDDDNNDNDVVVIVAKGDTVIRWLKKKNIIDYGLVLATFDDDDDDDDDDEEEEEEEEEEDEEEDEDENYVDVDDGDGDYDDCDDNSEDYDEDGDDDDWSDEVKENDEEDEEEEEQELKEHEIYVFWISDGVKEIVDKNTVRVVGRALYHRSLINRIKNNKEDQSMTQQGVVCNTNITFDIMFLHKGKKIVHHDVPFSKMKLMLDFTSGSYVLHKSMGWVGRITTSLAFLEISFPSGAKCIIPPQYVGSFDILKSDFHFSPRELNDFVVGQKVTGKPSDWEKCKWTKKIKNDDNNNNGSDFKYGVISKIIPNWLIVDWIQGLDPLQAISPPETALHYSQCCVLDDFPTCECFESGDQLLYFCNEDDILSLNMPLSPISKGNKSNSNDISNNGDNNMVMMDKYINQYYSRKNEQHSPLQKRQENKRNDHSNNSNKLTSHVAQILNIRTFVDVIWPSGIVEKKAPSTNFFVFENWNSHDFFVYDFVVDNRSEGENKKGFVTKIDISQRMAYIRWRKNELGNTINSMKNEDLNDIYQMEEEMISVYDIKDDRILTTGDFILCLDDTSTSFEEKVGSVRNLSDGFALCQFASGRCGKYLAEQLLAINVSEEEDEDEGEGENANDVNDEDGEDGEDGEYGYANEGIMRDFIPAATEFLRDNVDSIGEFLMASMLSDVATQAISPSQPVSENNQHQHVEQQQQGINNETKDDQKEEQKEQKKIEDISAFEVQSNCPADHHFQKTATTISSNNKMAIKAIHRDLKIISKNLPKGIFVRSFEDRMELLRAVIIGPESTPYEDALFVFDFKFPNNYPTSPPEVFFHSLTSEKMNPNLYVEGRVCLSLLGTWEGEGCEAWNPTESNMLQVLVSLQGLVLNDNPFFNEAGYDRLKGDKTNNKTAERYNENSIILAYQAMKVILEIPFLGIEDIIHHHFGNYKNKILNRLKNQLENNDLPMGVKLPLASLHQQLSKQMDSL